MTARMKNPAMLLPDALNALQTLGKVPQEAGADLELMELVHLRVSQINGCAWCLDYGTKNARKAGFSEDKLAMLAGWRDAPIFSDAERAALDLAEQMTRLADRGEVSDPVWEEATRHFDEKELAVLVLHIASTNVFNRLNVTVRQVPGTW